MIRLFLPKPKAKIFKCCESKGGISLIQRSEIFSATKTIRCVPVRLTLKQRTGGWEGRIRGTGKSCAYLSYEMLNEVDLILGIIFFSKVSSFL